MNTTGDGIVNSGRFMFEPLEHAIYKVVAQMTPGLNLDVGAAAGMYSSFMVRLSPLSRVIAFEPFPGNWTFFENANGQNPNITLRKEAVAAVASTVKFYVASTVSGSEPGWSTMQGYSSAGRIVSGSDPTATKAIDVPAIRLDDVVREPVRFCKIDVQGGEMDVLVGATRLIDEQGIDVFHIEFGGELEILEFLAARDYVFFDTQYLLIVNKKEPSPEAWHIVRPVKLSTGAKALYAWPRNAPRAFPDYCTWIAAQAKLIGGAYSDVVAVRRSALPAFLKAAGAALEHGSDARAHAF